VLCEQIRVIDKKRLLKKISKLSKLDMKHINRKISISLELKDKKY
jgi:mRNA interferase MazF